MYFFLYDVLAELSRTSVCIIIVARTAVLKPKDGDFVAMWVRKHKCSSIKKYYLSAFCVPGTIPGTRDAKTSIPWLHLLQSLLRFSPDRCLHLLLDSLCSLAPLSATLCSCPSQVQALPAESPVFSIIAEPPRHCLSLLVSCQFSPWHLCRTCLLFLLHNTSLILVIRRHRIIHAFLSILYYYQTHSHFKIYFELCE